MRTSEPSPPGTKPEPSQTAAFQERDALSWLFLSRLLLILALLLTIWLTDSTTWLPKIAQPQAARWLLLLQAGVILLSGLMIRLGWPRRDQQVQLAVFLDIAFAMMLIHLAGGTSTGFGLLPVLAVAWGALLLEGRQSLLFAALASIGVISVQIYEALYVSPDSGSYLEAGLLGLVYFSVAAMAHALARRMRASERLAARRQLDIANLSQLNDYVIRELSVGVLVIDTEQRIRLINSAARRLLGGSTWRRGAPLRRVAPTLFNWMTGRLRDETTDSATIRVNHNSLRPSLRSLGEQSPQSLLIYLHDEQEMLRQAQAMNLASLGRLSASVAHNIRNPLAAISHASQLLAESPRLDAEDQRLMTIINRNSARINEIVHSVLDLSSRHRGQPRRIELNSWLEELCIEYRETHALNGEALQLQCPSATVTVEVDPTQLHQILSNLLDNARTHGADAQGHCALTCALKPPDRKAASSLSVTDRGPGIDPSQRQTIFEPFFTTAASGTGLGLYAARALAESNGLSLAYSDAEHGGACFTLTFPAASGPPHSHDQGATADR